MWNTEARKGALQLPCLSKPPSANNAAVSTRNIKHLFFPAPCFLPCLPTITLNQTNLCSIFAVLWLRSKFANPSEFGLAGGVSLFSVRMCFPARNSCTSEGWWNAPCGWLGMKQILKESVGDWPVGFGFACLPGSLCFNSCLVQGGGKKNFILWVSLH